MRSAAHLGILDLLEARFDLNEDSGFSVEDLRFRVYGLGLNV